MVAQVLGGRGSLAVNQAQPPLLGRLSPARLGHRSRASVSLTRVEAGPGLLFSDGPAWSWPQTARLLLLLPCVVLRLGCGGEVEGTLGTLAPSGGAEGSERWALGWGWGWGAHASEATPVVAPGLVLTLCPLEVPWLIALWAGPCLSQPGTSQLQWPYCRSL